MIVIYNRPRIPFFFSAILVTGLFFATNLFANVRLPAIFSDNMVLQQQSKVAVWGWADPGERITIAGSWSAKFVSFTTDATGNWKGFLQTPKAGAPYTLKIKGKNSIELSDVLIGEVWVCSGQSNMVMAVKASENAKSEMAAADLPLIRYFSVKRQYGSQEFNDAPGSLWEKTSPQNAGTFSAVAYYFAKKIHKDLNVPVGIVYAAWGGTPAEAWTQETVLKNDPLLSLYIDRWKKIQDDVGKDSVAYYAAVSKWKKDSTASKKPAEPQTFFYYKRPWRQPAVLYNGMINPVIPYCIKGFLWYQGESNVAYADEHYHLFSSMINSWRSKWSNNNLPFYFVQIAPFNYSNLDAAARLRESQYQVMQNIPNTGMAVTVDIGNMKNQHPVQKKEVGERLALIALNKTYGFKNTVFAGPTFKKAIIDKKKVHVIFDQKLFTTNNQKAGGFEIGYKEAGSDSLQFGKAEATIENMEVVVWNTKVQQPLFIRYAWVNIAEANLLNNEGLPAFPFSNEIKIIKK